MRHLALILTLVLSVQQANSQDYDKLISLADSSYEANNYILSGQYFDKAFNVDNRNHYDAYNAACSWALAGHLKSQWSYEWTTREQLTWLIIGMWLIKQGICQQKFH